MQLGIWLRDWMLATSSHQRPAQIAWAVTCGILLGLLPKATGLFFIAAAVCFCLPVHLPLLIITAFTVSLATPFSVAPVGRLGIWSLTESPFAALLLRMDGLPLVPWLGLHNSVVFGSFLIWMATALPITLIALITARFLAPQIALSKNLLSNRQHLPEQLVASDLGDYQELRSINGVLVPGLPDQLKPPVAIYSPVVSTTASLSQSEFQLEKPNYLDEFEDDISIECEIPTTDDIIRRAANLADWAEEAIASVLQSDAYPATTEESTTSSGMSHSVTGVSADLSNSANSDDDQWVIETTMEVVRIAEQAVTQQANLKIKPPRDGDLGLSTNIALDNTFERTDSKQDRETSNMNSMQDTTFDLNLGGGVNCRPPASNSEGQAQLPIELRSDASDAIRRQQLAHGDMRNHLPKNQPTDQPREEALRYLLRHLKGIQDKVQKQ